MKKIFRYAIRCPTCNYDNIIVNNFYVIKICERCKERIHIKPESNLLLINIMKNAGEGDEDERGEM